MAMTQSEFIDSFPAGDLKILPGGNITVTPSTPESAKIAKAMLTNTRAMFTSMTEGRPMAKPEIVPIPVNAKPVGVLEVTSKG